MGKFLMVPKYGLNQSIATTKVTTKVMGSAREYEYELEVESV